MCLVSELKFVESADKLAENLRELRQRSRFLAQKIKELRGHVGKQVEELHRTEVRMQQNKDSKCSSANFSSERKIRHFVVTFLTDKTEKLVFLTEVLQ